MTLANIFLRKKIKRYVFNFKITYTTENGKTIETGAIHIIVPAIDEARAKRKLEKFIFKKILIKYY